MPFIVEVTDLPMSALEAPVNFRLGPFETLEEAERIAERAKATGSRSEATVCEDNREDVERGGEQAAGANSPD